MLGSAGKVLMFTDALLVNRNSFASKKKREEIEKFIEFRTDTQLMHDFETCADIPKTLQCPRLVLPAKPSFYSRSLSLPYMELYNVAYDLFRSNGIAVPNYQFYSRKNDINKNVSKMLFKITRG